MYDYLLNILLPINIISKEADLRIFENKLFQTYTKQLTFELFFNQCN